MWRLVIAVGAVRGGRSGCRWRGNRADVAVGSDGEVRVE